MKTKQLLFFLGGLALGLVVGCGPGGKIHTGRSTTVSVVVTSSVTKIGPAGTFTLTATVTGTGTNTWTQIGGPSATITGSGNTVTVTAPTSGNAGWMDFRATVTASSGGATSNSTLSVLYNGTPEHNAKLEFVNSTSTTTPDSVRVTMTRKDGKPIVGNRQVIVELVIVLPSGTLNRSGVMFPDLANNSLETTVSLGNNTAGQPVFFTGVNTLTVLLKENTVILAQDGPGPPTGNTSVTYPVP